MRAAIDFPRPMGAPCTDYRAELTDAGREALRLIDDGIRLHMGSATVAVTDEDVLDGRTAWAWYHDAANCAYYTGTAKDATHADRMLAALLYAFVTERGVTLEPPVASAGLDGWTATVRAPMGGVIQRTAPTARAAVVALWQEYVRLEKGAA
jgi:hypothetical protein